MGIFGRVRAQKRNNLLCFCFSRSGHKSPRTPASGKVGRYSICIWHHPRIWRRKRVRGGGVKGGGGEGARLAITSLRLQSHSTWFQSICWLGRFCFSVGGIRRRGVPRGWAEVIEFSGVAWGTHSWWRSWPCWLREIEHWQTTCCHQAWTNWELSWWWAPRSCRPPMSRRSNGGQYSPLSIWRSWRIRPFRARLWKSSSGAPEGLIHLNVSRIPTWGCHWPPDRIPSVSCIVLGRPQSYIPIWI